MSSPLHPIWSIFRFSVCMVTLCFVLWLFASKFDETEIYVLVAFFFAGASAESAPYFLDYLTNFRNPIKNPPTPPTHDVDHLSESDALYGWLGSKVTNQRSHRRLTRSQIWLQSRSENVVATERASDEVDTGDRVTETAVVRTKP